MENKPKRPASKKLLYTLILLLMLFVLVEVIFSVFLYHKHGNESLATIEAMKMAKAMLKGERSSVNVDNQKLVRPAASEEMNRQIAAETHNSNRFEYEPWVEFRNIDYKGKYVNVSASQRKSVPAEYINPSSKDTVDIYFFGGSTTFGFNVSDEETIPSQFVQLYKDKYPAGKSIRVHNFGTPTYYSYQELVLFTKLLFEGKRPDIVIFVDGVNDFWFAKASYYNQSYFSYILRQVFNQNLAAGGKFNFKDTADRMYKDPENIPLDTYNTTLVQHYFSNIRNAGMMAGMSGAKCYFFCQPVPFYKYPNQQKDPICFKDQHTRYDQIYPMIEKQADSLPGFTFLGNMLEKETGYPFVDGLHYSPAFTRKVTEQILLKVEEALK
ncbi:MAG TPA: SGNH/GDSL hydrolase family protein [Chitinophagaceae bacterium]|nr:SGNH/GDSL hydrolase family protein [Chitinophagaceae bacterium]